MALFGVNNIKIVSINEDKTRGLIFEYPKDMGLNEILAHIEVFKNAVLEAKEKETANANVENQNKDGQQVV
jgi:hypothetical protein